jgi:L-seryl-tRNA(Ser) seleniumtransferase
MQAQFRKLPSVDRLLQRADGRELASIWSHDLAVEALRHSLELAREQIRAGMSPPSAEELVAQAQAFLTARYAFTLRPAINATGVVIHTNLGRAPLSGEARAAMDSVATGYSNLEYDLEMGQRGSRYVHAEALLCRLTGAEAALVVNNNAAAVLLMLMALTRGREVILSRSQLIEIGGGFRIPDVMRQSGARLIEVGTTNRTYVRDYAEAIGEHTAALMVAHRSNFRLSGFVHDPRLEDLAALAREREVLLLEDLGSGTLLDTAEHGLLHEPTIQESLAAGADLVSCSGDKLLGGPQSGIILGRNDLVAQLKRFPLTRALRVDKTTLAGLQATLRHYLLGEALERVPVWQMIAASPADLEQRATAWVQALHAAGVTARVMEGRSAIGGGSLPEETLPTYLLSLDDPAPDQLAVRLRAMDPPVVARIEDDGLVLDPRTVLGEQEEALLSALVSAAGPRSA